jgi:hypothetical protein
MSMATETNYSLISDKIYRLRQRWSWYVVLDGLAKSLILITLAAFILIGLEGFRFFSSVVRREMLFFFIGFGSLFLLVPIILALMVRYEKIASYSDKRLADAVGKQFPAIGDKLLNAIQLNELASSLDQSYSQELAEYSIHRVAEEIRHYHFEDLIPWYKLRKSGLIYGLLIICLIIVTVFNFTFYKQAAIRLLHPGIEYVIPQPFTICSLHGTRAVLGGDTVKVDFRCTGNYPAAINLQARHPEFQQDEILIVNDSGYAAFQLTGVRNTIVYEAFVENKSIFRPWRRISSGSDTIFVADRPEILAVKTRIEYPAYTNLPAVEQESNSTEFAAFPGSDCQIRILANKSLSRAQIHFDSGEKLTLRVNDKVARGDFKIFKGDEFWIRISDHKEVMNLNPIKYRIRLMLDTYPTCQLISPDADFDLNETMTIPLGIRISDDFGFSRALICYHLIKRYNPDETVRDSVDFPLNNRDLTLQELYYGWDVGNLNLSPEDLIEFWVKVYDNDVINGPKPASSRSLQARFPSLNDLFAQVNEERDQITAEGEDVLQDLERTRDDLEEISRELLKDRNLSWEQKNQLQKEIEKIKESGEKLAKAAGQLDEMIQQSRENQLFDEETLQKYTELQEAFQQVMTPELRDAMEKLQKALDKMEPEEIRQALNHFQITRDQFSRELDRMLQLLERVKVEQSVAELVKRFEDLLERQQNINNELQPEQLSEAKYQQLADEEKAVGKDTEIARDLMDNTKSDMQPFPLMPARQLEQIIREFDESSLRADLKQAQKMMNAMNRQKSQESASSAQAQMEQLLTQMQQLKTEFNQQAMAEVMGDFRGIIYKTLQLSQHQEKLSEEIQQTPRQSERLMDVAVNQQQLQQNLAGLIEDLIALSGKTFGMSPGIGKGLGQASSAMNRAIQEMEERDATTAAQAARQATGAINQTALELINSMNNLQASGSASGFEEYLKQLQQMAGAQQGINDDTQLLSVGQDGTQSGIRKLAVRQQQLRQSLEQLRDEIGNSSKSGGDLNGIAKDMDEVIKDLQQNRVLRETLERQQRILTRLLDAQKSLRTQDFKKERISKTGADANRESPQQLPGDLGEKRSLLQENLEKALKEGYTLENEELIRQYFELLSKEIERK